MAFGVGARFWFGILDDQLRYGTKMIFLLALYGTL